MKRIRKLANQCKLDSTASVIFLVGIVVRIALPSMIKKKDLSLAKWPFLLSSIARN